MPAEYRIRPVGRPKIDRASNGLRTITRRYVVQGEAVALGNIETLVFMPFGTLDREYNSIGDATQVLGAGGVPDSYVEDLGASDVSAYLVAQKVEPSEEVTQAFLTRVYQELEDTPKPVQVDMDDVVLNDAKRVTVQRKFIVKNIFGNDESTFKPTGAITPYVAHLDSARIGVSYITFDGKKCYLGGVQSDEHEVHTEYTETYFQDAILSITVEYRNGLKPNHKLEIRTLRAIAGASVLEDMNSITSLVEDYGTGPGDGRWYLVSQRQGTGSADFGNAGKPVHTMVWAKGEGIVSLQRNFKHNGLLELVSIRSLGVPSEVADAGTAANGAEFYKISESMQESSGHQVFNATYAAGVGLISYSKETKGKIDIVTETWISEPGKGHQSELENITRESLSQRDGYDLHVVSGTTELDGVINISRQYKHLGADGKFDLEIVRVTKIGSYPVVDDFKGTEAAYGGEHRGEFILIAKSKDESGRYKIFTATFAAGKGTIQTGERNTGKITIKSYTSLNTAFPEEGSYDHTESDRDGYIIRTYKTYEVDSGFVSDKSKRWINKFVYQENTSKIEEAAPTLAAAANDVAGSYTKQGPEDIWSTTDTDVSVDETGGVVAQNVSYVSSGNYFTVTKRVATAEGAEAATYAPPNSVQIGHARSYERGWVSDTFTWAALAESLVSMTISDIIPWTLPGVITISSREGGRAGVIGRTNPAKVNLEVKKITSLSTSPFPTTEGGIKVLGVPWAAVTAHIPFVAKKDPYVLEETRHNCVYHLKTSRIPAWEYFMGFKTAANQDVDIQGVSIITYNFDAALAYLSYRTSVAFTDGTNFIYRLDTVVGSPTLNVDRS